MANNFEPWSTLKKLDNIYNDFKDWTSKFSNKFDVGIVYVLNVGIIIIIL
jgi:hypothetical protein